jgi:hypothetical protein
MVFHLPSVLLKFPPIFLPSNHANAEERRRAIPPAHFSAGIGAYQIKWCAAGDFV